MEGIGEWSSFFLHKHTYYQLYNSCYFSPLPNSILGDQQMSWREVEGEAWKEPLWSCCSFPDGCKGMSLWPRTQWPVQLSQCSWSRLFFPGLRKNGKKSKKKAPNRKKEESASSCPSSSPSGSAYTAPPSWPTKLSGLGCAWAQSSMLFKQTNVQFEMPVALLCPS